jgi:hypothetical protein
MGLVVRLIYLYLSGLACSVCLLSGYEGTCVFLGYMECQLSYRCCVTELSVLNGIFDNALLLLENARMFEHSLRSTTQ